MMYTLSVANRASKAGWDSLAVSMEMVIRSSSSPDKFILVMNIL